MHASAPDLLSFAHALRSGRLLEPTFIELTTVGKLPRPPEGLPSRSHCYDDIVAATRIYGHSGDGPGTATRLDIAPDKDWTRIILSNYDTPIAPIVSLARQLITPAA